MMTSFPRNERTRVFPQPALSQEWSRCLQARFDVYCRRYEAERTAARRMATDELETRFDAAQDELEKRRWTM